MFYFLYSQNYDDFETHGLFEGPDGIDVLSLQKKFYDHLNLPGYSYPEYNGPMSQSKKADAGSVIRASGSFAVGEFRGFYPDTDSPEYKQWIKDCDKIRGDWIKERARREDECRAKYPGQTMDEMFLKKLEIDYGFKRIQFKEVRI